jgi:hypothetical protein
LEVLVSILEALVPIFEALVPILEVLVPIFKVLVPIFEVLVPILEVLVPILEVLVPNLNSVNGWPCHGSIGQSPASHCGGPGSIPVHYIWDLWWTKWHWDRFFSRVLRFSPVSFIPLVLHYMEKFKKLVVFITVLHNKP